MAINDSLEKLNAALDKIAVIGTKPFLAGALVLQDYSMVNAPVDTGNLRNSHSSVETEKGAEMQVYAEYAVHVEFGTKNMAAIPYVRPAIDEHANDIVKAVAQEAEAELRRKL